MTEAEWLSCADPTRLMQWERIATTERKLRLFAVACCRRIPALNSDAILAAVIDTVERFADRLATEEEVRDAHLRADSIADSAGETADDCESVEGLSENTVRWQAVHCAAWATHWASFPGELRTVIDRCPGAAADGVGLALVGRDYEVDQLEKGATEERAVQADLFRDIIGNPFRPVDFSTSWRTGTAVSLARQMDESRDFSAMPILGDALQDAGCDNDDLLNHCRGPGQHVRGCWVVDLVLGQKEPPNSRRPWHGRSERFSWGQFPGWPLQVEPDVRPQGHSGRPEISQWVRTERWSFRLDPSPICPLLGRRVPVEVHTGEDEIQPDQLEALTRFLAIPADERRSLYGPLYADYREVHGAIGAGRHIERPEEMWALVRWDTVLVPRQGPTGRRFVFVQGRPAWEVEHGVVLLFRDEQLVHVGRAEGDFLGRFWEWLGRRQAEPLYGL
jgi:hypothetical protein